MPNPNPGEKKNDFLNRCIPAVINDGIAIDATQGYAVCVSKWESMTSDKNHTPIKELLIDEKDGVSAIALVEFPAIEVDFLKFNKVENVSLATADAERMVITGPALIPNKMIFRRDDKTNEEFYVYFNADTVRRISEKYLIDKNNDSVNIQHEVPVNDISLVESWIVDDPSMDKSKALGYSVPKGTWMCSMKVNNVDVWQKLVKEGIVKGFSIEGSFVEKFASRTTVDDDIYNKIIEIIKQIK